MTRPLLPLEGTTVLDMTRLTPGAYATMLLSDLGADVIKIERPGDGDYLRTLVPAAYETLCRGKRSVTLNLKSAEGRDLLGRLLNVGSVVVENFRPGVGERVGLDHNSLARHRSDVIVCSISGYGHSGPYRDLSGHDLNYLSVSGALSLMGSPTGPPAHHTGIAIADFNAATFAALAVLAAVVHRSRTGHGQHIDVSMTDCMVSWMVRYANEVATDPNASREVMMSKPGYGVFDARDGRRLSLGCIEDVFWRNLLSVVPAGSELQKFADPEQRQSQRARVTDLLRELFATDDRDSWLNRLRAADVPVAPVNELQQVAEDPQNAARGLQPAANDPRYLEAPFPAVFSGMATAERGPAPQLGEHNGEVWTALGIEADEIARLTARGVL